MARDWESIFNTWSQGPSQSEEERIENTERQIKEAINSSQKLRNRNIKIFIQGSYRNRVNVKNKSDIDVGVLCYDTFFPEYPDDNVKSHFDKSFSSATYTYIQFKNELEEALVNRFGRQAVTRGNKAIDIKANTYRVEADVSAFFEHRRYSKDYTYISGVEMIPDNGNPSRVRNWPEQHYTNGVDKNTLTNRRYKRVVRILKKLCNEMSDQGILEAKDIPGFLIECLVWNVPNSYFTTSNYKSLIREVLVFLYNSTSQEENCSEWGEVSELKYLFRTSQPWTSKQVNKFILAAWNYVGYQ